MARLRARVTLCLERAHVEGVYRSLKAEEAQPSPERGRVSVSRQGDCVVIRVEPRDASSLRALLSSFLYLAHAAADALEKSGGGEAG